MYIKNNDVVLCQAYIPQGGEGEMGTCTAIAQLVTGDSVRVTGDSGNPAQIQGSWSGFTGHIISDNLTA